MGAHERIQILNLEVDTDDVSDFRILVDSQSFKYVTIDHGVYETSVMVWDRRLIPVLPPFPKGEWNEGHIARHPDTGMPYFAQYSKVELPGIHNEWHSTRINWLDLQRGEKLMSNVYIATISNKAITEHMGLVGDDLVIKFARFPWEMQYYVAETGIYKLIEGLEIAPGFIGHLTEEGRVIGFALERIKDARHPGPDDLKACQEALGKLHRQGILHGDVNKHNFLIHDSGGQGIVTIVDFECALKSTDKLAFEEETGSLQAMLDETDGSGGYYLEGNHNEQES